MTALSASARNVRALAAAAAVSLGVGAACGSSQGVTAEPPSGGDSGAAGSTEGGLSSGGAGGIAAAGAGASAGGAEASAGAGGGGGTPRPWSPGPSCAGLADTCGPNHDESCCASSVVPGGTFLRDNGVAGEFYATVSDFRLDRFEVTVGRFRNFVAGYADHKPAVGSGRNPGNDRDLGWDATWNESLPATEDDLKASVLICDERFTTFAADDDALPMNCITWFEAYAFCIWDGGRLPTDAETNYVATGGDQQRMFPWSDPPEAEDIDSTRAVYLPEAEKPAIVGSKPLGDGRWGHADLSGNEWEWCQDWYRTYPDRCINCANLTEYSIRVIRGGSFYSDRESLYSSSRLYHAPNQRDFGVGVRCAYAP